MSPAAKAVTGVAGMTVVGSSGAGEERRSSRSPPSPPLRPPPSFDEPAADHQRRGSRPGPVATGCRRLHPAHRHHRPLRGWRCVCVGVDVGSMSSHTSSKASAGGAACVVPESPEPHVQPSMSPSPTDADAGPGTRPAPSASAVSVPVAPEVRVVAEAVASARADARELAHGLTAEPQSVLQPELTRRRAGSGGSRSTLDVIERDAVGRACRSRSPPPVRRGVHPRPRRRTPAPTLPRPARTRPRTGRALTRSAGPSSPRSAGRRLGGCRRRDRVVERDRQRCQAHTGIAPIVRTGVGIAPAVIGPRERPCTALGVLQLPQRVAGTCRECLLIGGVSLQDQRRRVRVGARSRPCTPTRRDRGHGRRRSR